MNRNTSLLAVLFALLPLFVVAGCSNLTPSEQLESMFEKTLASEQADGPMTPNEVNEKRRRMDRRAVRVREFVENDQLVTAQDDYRAAVILYDSQEVEDVILAQELALRAHDSGLDDGMRIVAHCMDRSLMMRRKPQHFGTQIVFEAVLTKWRLWDLDPATTDDERQAFGVASLAELQARVGYLNETR